MPSGAAATSRSAERGGDRSWTAPKNGLRGGQRRYWDLAILNALTLRLLFRLPLRQTEGFIDSLLSWMDLDLKAPDHTTLSRRNQIVEVQPLTRAHDGPIDLIVDSTGLKILSSGEWNIHKHKASKRRRAWRKLHIGVDEEGFIVAAALTPGSLDDARPRRDCTAWRRLVAVHPVLKRAGIFGRERANQPHLRGRGPAPPRAFAGTETLRI